MNETWFKKIGYSPYQLVNVGFFFTNHVCYVDPQKSWFLNACTVWWWFPFIRPAIKPLFLRDARGTCHLPVVRSWMPINASSQGGSRTVRAIVLQEGQGQFRQRWQKLQMGKCLDSSQVLGSSLTFFCDIFVSLVFGEISTFQLSCFFPVHFLP